MIKNKLEKILIVEPSEHHRKAAEHYFNGLNVEVLYAKNVEEAIGNHLHYVNCQINDEDCFEEGKTYFDELVTKPMVCEVDGVITDLYLPWDDGKVPLSNYYTKIRPGYAIDKDPSRKEIDRIQNLMDEVNNSPNGLIVASACDIIKKPCVISIAGHKHGKMNAWANQLSEMHFRSFIDGGSNEDIIAHGDVKPYEQVSAYKKWDYAFSKLKSLVEYMKE